MNGEKALVRAQVYQSLAHAVLYPEHDWTEDFTLLPQMLEALDAPAELHAASRAVLSDRPLALEDLQAEHRKVFGLSGSLSYETEYGLPHEFRQSQEMADIAGFYRAFGFIATGGPVRDRPDHIAAELEFMQVLALKYAYAAQNDLAEPAEVCLDGQRSFLRDHLGRWVAALAWRVEQATPASLYARLARFLLAFVSADAARLGVSLPQPGGAELRPTPLGPDLACEGCPAVEALEQE